MSRSIIERLRDARAFAHEGEYRVLGLGHDTFASVAEVRYTVYYCLIGIGEALKQIPADVLGNDATIPWESIIGMRNRLVHAYWRIDDNIVYDIATTDLPALGLALDKMIKQLT